jgi:hypothetical protein
MYRTIHIRIYSVHALMSDEQIVCLLTQDDDDQPASDESDPECEKCTTTAQEALYLSSQVKECVANHPESFSAGQVASVVGLNMQHERMQLQNKTQSTIDAYFST